MGQNQKLFREMSQPHESRDALNKAHEAFYEELGELRKKHKIANVVTIIEDSYDNGKDESSMLTAFAYGDGLKAESMSAYAYGTFKRKREEMLASLLAGK